MSAPKVSLLLPCFNAREFLEPRIESIRAQTFSNWEAIVLDSHSTDGSWEFFQPIAEIDPRFRFYQIPREGVYAALNRGLAMAASEFVSVATCDDTMAPNFLRTMLDALAQFPEAGIAACDLRMIDRRGDVLAAENVAGHLPPRAIEELLQAGTVRSAPVDELAAINLRPTPHDCLLHFDGRSVYYSLTQVLVRTVLAKSAPVFDTTIGSIADFDWLLRLTNIAATVHVPEKLATWRFHGNQLSMLPDESRLTAMKAIYERTLPDIRAQHRHLLTRNDCAALLLPCKTSLANSFWSRIAWRLEAAFRVTRMFIEKPVATAGAIGRSRFRIGDLKRTLVPMLLLRVGCVPEIPAHERT